MDPMSPDQPSLDAVIRFPGVALSREELEAALLLDVDRFQTSRDGLLHYAQINLPEGSSWDDLVQLLDRIGPAIGSYLEAGELSRPRIDAALYFGDDKASTSLLIPSAVAAAVGRCGFDFEISVYLAAST